VLSASQLAAKLWFKGSLSVVQTLGQLLTRLLQQLYMQSDNSLLEAAAAAAAAAAA
jgi:hypothetical protein